MGYLVIFLIGMASGIILMGLCVTTSLIGLCVTTSHRDEIDEKRKDIRDEIACYCDKE